MRRGPRQVPPIRIEEQYAKRLVAGLAPVFALYHPLLAGLRVGHNSAPRTDDFDPGEDRDGNGRWTGGGAAPAEVSSAEFTKARDELLPRLTPSQQRTISTWSSDGYKGLQMMARGGSPSLSRVPAIRDLDSAIASSPTSRDMMLYRGFNGQRLAGAKVGDVFSDKGFVATSTNRTTAEWFAGTSGANAKVKNTGALVRVTVPRGTGALPVKGQTDSEHEMLLGRNSRFKITDIRTEKTWDGRRTVVDVVLLPPEMAQPARHDTLRVRPHDPERFTWSDDDLEFEPRPLTRTDTPESDRLKRLIGMAAKNLRETIEAGRVRTAGLAKTFAARTAAYQGEQLSRHVHDVLGIEPTKIKDADISHRTSDFVRDNVSLISRIPVALHSDVEELVGDAVRVGRRNEALSRDIHERFGVSERHARLIARDQIGKYYSNVNHTRQRSLGIRQFTWRTVGDERVRPSHDELDGEVFDYDDPPEVDGELALPGEPVQCRCYADPVLDDLV